MAFLPYEREVEGAGPRVSTDNAYPYAAERILSLFDDPDPQPGPRRRAHPAALLPGRGRPRGEHGSLDVIQSRAPLVLAGAGVARRGYVDDHARLVDVGPTLAALAGVPRGDLRDAAGARARRSGARRIPRTRPSGPAGGRRRFSGTAPTAATCCTSPRRGSCPAVARLVERGLALRGGAVAEFPSVTLTNHTSILTGIGPGRHGVLGNVFYDRATGERVVPNDADDVAPVSAEWLRPAVRTVFEMVTTM